MFGLEQDFSAFYALARSESKLHKAIEKAGGRVLRCPTLFEDVIKTILTTNTLWNGTKRMAQRLVDFYGEAAPGGERRAFPTPQRLAGLSEEELRQTVRLGYRAPYVLDLARRIAGGVRGLGGMERPGFLVLGLVP